MVSDPKLYNPKIVPTKSIDVGAGDEVGRRSSDSLDEQQARCSTSTNAHQNINIVLETPDMNNDATYVFLTFPKSSIMISG